VALLARVGIELYALQLSESRWIQRVVHSFRQDRQVSCATWRNRTPLHSGVTGCSPLGFTEQLRAL
jgi:hypothetical protein